MGTLTSFGSVGVLVCLGVLCVALTPIDAHAFNTERAHPAAARGNAEKTNVIVFDNAYLDKRFGRTGVTETSSIGEDGRLAAHGRKTGHASAFFSAGFMEIAPNGSLLKGITPGTPARRAAGLRLAENGRKAVQNRQHRKAIYYLEKALGIDASPFVHFYLARAHYQLADYQRALEFLEVAESGFDGHDPWLPELAALRRALSAAPAAAEEPLERVHWTHKDRSENLVGNKRNHSTRKQ
jgi:tetratricopeptide (TPR) repeat protein